MNWVTTTTTYGLSYFSAKRCFQPQQRLEGLPPSNAPIPAADHANQDFRGITTIQDLLNSGFHMHLYCPPGYSLGNKAE